MCLGFQFEAVEVLSCNQKNTRKCSFEFEYQIVPLLRVHQCLMKGCVESRLTDCNNYMVVAVAVISVKTEHF